MIFYTDPKDVPAAAHGIALVDTIKDQPKGVLGYHTEDPGGKLWGVVAAKPELDNGGKATTGNWSVSSVLSHEVLEMYIDPNCNLWANDGHGKAYSFEVCDPVEAPTYPVNGVSVSNFVTPAWFDPLSDPATAQYDKLATARPVQHSERRLRRVRGCRRRASAVRRHVPNLAQKMKSGKLARTRRGSSRPRHCSRKQPYDDGVA